MNLKNKIKIKIFDFIVEIIACGLIGLLYVGLFLFL